MSREINRRPSSETLSVGNVVSAGLRIYRDNFKVYYLEALKNYLWVLVPVYGWAKFAAIQAVIARLAFFEVRETPESLADARRQVMPKMWIFLVTGILSGLILIISLFGLTILSGLILLPGFFLFGLSIFFFLPLFFIFAYLWLISRITFAELAITIDGIKEATKAIGRSWTITQGFVVKIQIIFFIASLLTIPFIFFITFLLTIPFSIVNNLESLLLQNPEMGTVINLLLNIPLGALLVPFWQSIKAVIYYDLLTRKEGLGLELRELNDNF